MAVHEFANHVSGAIITQINYAFGNFYTLSIIGGDKKQHRIWPGFALSRRRKNFITRTVTSVRRRQPYCCRVDAHTRMNDTGACCPDDHL